MNSSLDQCVVNSTNITVANRSRNDAKPLKLFNFEDLNKNLSIVVK